MGASTIDFAASVSDLEAIGDIDSPIDTLQVFALTA